ncbi:ABC transporter permease [Opitutus terrae]|uniref:Permease n=1 Tax=Opitutus terrae (strain DSM 11246 / JCM 15787 / PB90-1) TaxID=452637 RepID=B1ZXW4_OPITP|nr:ABC transporter permease [Opitutus terrae]ACB75166.1 permease [Opitutus terrae PB90-1]
MSDLRFALRQLAKAPGFTAIAVLSLALGIGATTTVFCWIQGILLNPLPGVHRQEEIVVLTTSHADQMWDTCSLPDIKDYREQRDVFAGIIASQVTPACLTIGEQSTWLYGQIATANFFDLLGVQPLLGRLFLPDEDQKPGGNPVLVLGERFWRRQFNGDPSVIGKAVQLNRHAFTVIGVAPASFRGTMSGLICDFWAPLSMHHAVANMGSLEQRDDHWLHTQARLQPGVSREQAQAVVDAVAARLEKSYPNTNQQIRLHVLDFLHAPYGVQPIMGPVLAILLAVSLGVVLIVAANLASLLLARAAGRQKEIAIRLAVGASRVRLVRQLLTESLLLAGLGGGLGIVIAFWAVDLLKRWQPPTPLPIGIGTEINTTTLAFTVCGSIVTGVLFGLIPALRASRPDLNSTLKDGGRTSSSGSSHQRLRSLLVLGEVALSLVLLVGAGLCIKSAQRAYHAELGFKPDRVLLAGLRIGMNGYNEATGKVFYARLQERLARLPGVESVALSSWFPLGFEGGPQHGVTVQGHEQKPGEDSSLPYSIVSPGYFATLGIPLVDGRDFTDHDDDSALKVAIINETMAKRYWPGQNAIGHKFKAAWRELTVVGVAKDGKYRSLNEPPRGFFYTPFRQGVWDLNLGLCLRTRGDPSLFGATLQRELRQLDPNVAVWATITMDDYIKAAFMAPVLASRLLTWLGIVALVLAAMGVYGVVAYVVSQRTQEFGVRMALGASTGDVLRLVIGQGMRVAVLGIGVGLLGAFAVTRLLAGFLYGVSPFDALTFGAVTLGLALVSLLACWLPARRATKVDPVDALRAE